MPSRSNRRRFAAAAAATTIALALRLRAVDQLPIDFDEDDYLRAAQLYAAGFTRGDPGVLLDVGYRPENPPLQKIAFGLAITPLPPAEEIPDRPPNAAPAARLPEPHLGVCRRVAAAFGTLAVLALSTLDPLAGLLLGVHTFTIKYSSQAMLESLPALTSLLAVMAYTRSEGQKRGWLACSAVMLGLTAAGKYLYCIAGIAILVDGALSAVVPPLTADSEGRSPPAPWSNRLGAMIAWGALSLIAFFVADPYLWPDPLHRLGESVSYHGAYAHGADVLGAGFPPWQPFVWLTESVPWHPGVFVVSLDLAITILALLGLPRLWRERRVHALWLLLALAFLLIWPVKWPQYTITLTAPLSLAAAAGLRAALSFPARARLCLDRRGAGPLWLGCQSTEAPARMAERACEPAAVPSGASSICRSKAMSLSLVFHVHQPRFVTSSGRMPFANVRHHAVRSLHGLLRFLEETPHVRATVAVTPAFIEQLLAYAAGTEDEMLAAMRRPTESLAPEERASLARACAPAAWELNLQPRLAWTAYGRELEAMARERPEEMSLPELLDLAVLYELSFFHASLVKDDAWLQELTRQGRGFTEDQKLALLDRTLSLTGQTLPRLRALARTGAIELATTPRYGGSLPLLCGDVGPERWQAEAPLRPDADEQIQRALRYHESVFEMPALGLVAPQGELGERSARVVAEHGLHWVACSSAHPIPTESHAPSGVYRSNRTPMGVLLVNRDWHLDTGQGSMAEVRAAAFARLDQQLEGDTSTTTDGRALCIDPLRFGLERFPDDGAGLLVELLDRIERRGFKTTRVIDAVHRAKDRPRPALAPVRVAPHPLALQYLAGLASPAGGTGQDADSRQELRLRVEDIDEFRVNGREEDQQSRRGAYFWCLFEHAKAARQELPAIALPGYESAALAWSFMESLIYRAFSSRHGEVAIKIYYRTPEATPERVAAFTSRIRRWSAVSHPNLVRVIEPLDLEATGCLGYAMEIVRDAVSIGSFAGRGAPAPASRTRVIAGGFLAALAHLHERGMVHGDIATNNVLVRSDGQAVVIDFAINDMLPPSVNQSFDHALDGLSHPFLSPERLAAARDSGRLEPSLAGDVFGAGVLLYQLLTGTTPRRRAPSPPSTFRDDLPASLDRVVHDALSPSPEKRPSARTLLDEIQAWQ